MVFAYALCMDHISLRRMTRDQWGEVASLIHRSTNHWYQSQCGHDIFACSPEQVILFCEVYESLDPGCCWVAIDSRSGAVVGSCFMHPRPTHVSLGIMNVDPEHFGRGIARRLLAAVTDEADRLGLPTRLISSAKNLDSFSLYSRAGFRPLAVFQDIGLSAPELGLPINNAAIEECLSRIRIAQPDDALTMAALEQEHTGLRRDSDFSYFISDNTSRWHTLVLDSPEGVLQGFLVSINQPACAMLGPGFAVDENTAAALIAAQLNHHAPHQLVGLIPSRCNALVNQLYQWGGKNLEIHLAQIRSHPSTPASIIPDTGVPLPSFLPESW